RNAGPARQAYLGIRPSILRLVLAVCLAGAAMAQEPTGKEPGVQGEPQRAPTAAEVYARGRKAERTGRIAEAYVLYSQAAAMSPNNKTYWQRSLALRTRASLEAKVAPKFEDTPSAAGDQADLDDPPEQQFDPPTAQDRADARKPLPPVELQAQPGVKDL